MSGVSVTAVALVALLAVFCLAALVLHLAKGTTDSGFKVKFGPFVFEYGARSRSEGDRKADEAEDDSAPQP